jgi:hypothetical protein
MRQLNFILTTLEVARGRPFALALALGPGDFRAVSIIFSFARASFSLYLMFSQLEQKFNQ